VITKDQLLQGNRAVFEYRTYANEHKPCQVKLWGPARTDTVANKTMKPIERKKEADVVVGKPQECITALPLALLGSLPSITLKNCASNLKQAQHLTTHMLTNFELQFW